jgi:hypothetical protein
VEAVARALTADAQERQLQPLATGVRNASACFIFGQAVATHLPTPNALWIALGLHPSNLPVRGAGWHWCHAFYVNVVTHPYQPLFCHEAVEVALVAVQSQKLAESGPSLIDLRKADPYSCHFESREMAMELRKESVHQLMRWKLWVWKNFDIEVSVHVLQSFSASPKTPPRIKFAIT